MKNQRRISTETDPRPGTRARRADTRAAEASDPEFQLFEISRTAAETDSERRVRNAHVPAQRRGRLAHTCCCPDGTFFGGGGTGRAAVIGHGVGEGRSARPRYFRAACRSAAPANLRPHCRSRDVPRALCVWTRARSTPVCARAWCAQYGFFGQSPRVRPCVCARCVCQCTCAFVCCNKIKFDFKLDNFYLFFFFFCKRRRLTYATFVQLQLYAGTREYTIHAPCTQSARKINISLKLNRFFPRVYVTENLFFFIQTDTGRRLKRIRQRWLLLTTAFCLSDFALFLRLSNVICFFFEIRQQRFTRLSMRDTKMCPARKRRDMRR